MSRNAFIFYLFLAVFISPVKAVLSDFFEPASVDGLSHQIGRN